MRSSPSTRRSARNEDERRAASDGHRGGGRGPDRNDRGPEIPAAPETVLELLDDDYALGILASVADEAKPARQLVSEVDASRATVYRRLNSLEDAGLVDTETAIHPEGHHRTVYEATLSGLTLSLDEEGLSVESVAVAE